MNVLQFSASLALLLAAAIHGTAGQKGCTFNGQNYENFAIFDHSNECAKLQCQFGKTVTYYEACGKDKDGICHRLNYMFVVEGTTYQCRKVSSGDGFDYVNEVAVPRIENCTENGRTYETFEKFNIGNGCTEYQCQNGEVVALDDYCEPSLDGLCHRLGEIFEYDGTVYNCTSREVNEDTVFEVLALDPQPTTSTKPQQCRSGGIDYNNYEIYTLPPSCDVRQCQNRRITILENSCLFRQDNNKCFHEGEEWVYDDKTYLCYFNETDNDVRIEQIAKGYAKCKRQEHWFSHLELIIWVDGCTALQCQDGKTVPVKQGCFWDDKCHDLNSIWQFGKSAYKCIFTEQLAYRVYEIDENGNIIGRPERTTLAPVFEEHCEALKADIILMLDGSQSVGRGNFKLMLQFLAKLLGAFNIGADNVRVGALVYSDVVKKVFDLKTYKDYDSVSKALQEIQTIGDITNTHKALDFIVDEDMFGTANGGRDDAPNILLVVTDGNSTQKDLTLTAVKRVKATPTQIVAVGIGLTIREELESIATSKDNVFLTASYTDLYSIITNLTKQTCNVILPTPEPTTPPTPEPTTPSTPATTKPPKHECPEVLKPPGCAEAKADLIFLFDASSGVGSENFQKKLNLAVTIVKTFTVSSERVQVGAVLINSNGERLFNLNSYLNLDAVSEALLAARYSGGTRQTEKALNLVHTEGLFNSNSGGRKNVASIIIPIIDGPSPDLENTTAEAKRLRDGGIQIISIGINNYVQEELVQISGDARNVFHSCSYRTFVHEISFLLKRLCEVTNETVPEPKGCLSPETNKCEQICNDTDYGVECSCREGFAVSTSDPNKCDLKPCSHHIKADIILIMDSSESIKSGQFKKALKFLAHFVDSFQVGVNDVQFAALVYSWNVVKLFGLNTFSNKEDMKKAILNAPHLKQSTMTGKALNYVYQNNMFGSENGGREDAKNVTILVTDGKSQYPEYTYKAAEVLTDGGVEIITIGVGKQIDRHDLGDLASHKDCRLYPASYDVLEDMLSQLIDLICTVSNNTVPN